MKKCKKCKGTGIVHVKYTTGSWKLENRSDPTPCPKCWGKGMK